MDETNKKLPITAFVASCDEGHLLERCLKGIDFCAEIFVIDMQSTDNTVEVANNMDAKLLQYPRYSCVEEALYYAIPNATEEWILLTDPDEVVGVDLARKINEIFNNPEQLNNYNEIKVPIQYYFKDYALKGTIWGGEEKTGRFIYQKNNITLTKLVHEGIKLQKDSKTLIIQRETPDLVLHHYWMTSYATFIEKVNRYIAKEGQRMYDNGIRYSLISHLKVTVNAFRSCYISTKGYKDGLIGLFLSLIWCYYSFGSWISLLKYSKNKQK